MPVVRRFHSVPARSESAGQSPRSGACGPERPGQPAGDEDDPESARPSRRGRGPVDPCPERAGSALGGQSRRGGGGGGRRWPSRQCVRHRDVGPREVGQPGPLPSATPGFRRRCTGRWPWRSFLEGRGPAGRVAVLVTVPPPPPDCASSLRWFSCAVTSLYAGVSFQFFRGLGFTYLILIGFGLYRGTR